MIIEITMAITNQKKKKKYPLDVKNTHKNYLGAKKAQGKLYESLSIQIKNFFKNE